MIAGGAIVVLSTALARLWRALSSTTARYRTVVPGSMSATSWNTRYGALSSVPMFRHRPLPTLARNVTSANASEPRFALTSRRLRPVAGTSSEIDGADRLRGRWSRER